MPIKTAPTKVLFLSVILFLTIFGVGCRKDFSGFFEKAKKSFNQKNYISAVDDLNLGLLHWKESDGLEAKAQAYQLLGQSHHRMRNTDKAIEAYREAVQNSTNTYDSAQDLGHLYLTKNQGDSAVDAFQKALRMKPDNPASLLGLANSYFALGRYKEAQATYQRVIDVSPGVKEALESLSIIKNRMFSSKRTVLHMNKSSKSYKPPEKKPDQHIKIKKSSKKKK